MGSLIEELQRREAAARREADELRGEIAQLNERLAQAEERVSRLEINGEAVAEILRGAGADQAGGGWSVAGWPRTGRGCSRCRAAMRRMRRTGPPEGCSS